MLWGVCGGLASYFGIDPTIIRIIFVLLIFVNGLGILAYIILAIVVPREQSAAAGDTAEENGEAVEEETRGRHRSRSILGVFLIVIGAVFLLVSIDLLWWLRWSFVWPVLIMVLGLLILLSGWRK